MNARRLSEIYRLELAHAARRPLFWILALILLATAYGLSGGHITISSGDTQVGGTKAYITSEFAVAQMFAFVVLLFYGFFLAIAAGMAVIADGETRIEELLHSTPLRPGEYVWGKFLAILTAFAGLLVFHLACTILFNHLVPSAEHKEIHGPFALIHYVRPALIFALPTMIFLGGVSFMVGEGTRKPILVFVLPVAMVLACGFFLWNWSPSWLDPRLNKLLMIVEPAGFRWLNETWLKVDRGVAFYNTAPMRFDLVFLANRVLLLAGGLAAVGVSARHLAGCVRETQGARVRTRRRLWPFARPAVGEPAADAAPGAARTAPALATLAMHVRPSSFLAALGDVARAELRELRSQPGLYLFLPLILLQTLGTSLLALGAFDTPLLLTSGTIAARAMNTITLLVCLLLLFYTVESVERERASGLAAVSYATPVRTAAMLFGKALANSVVALVVVLGALVGAGIALLVQHRVGFDPRPFALLWGVLLLPTVLLWTSFTLAVFAVTGSRYATYGIALGVLILTGYEQLTNRMSWVGNWDLWGTVRWSDIDRLEIDRPALVLNRLFALGLTVLFTVIAVRIFPRRERDAAMNAERLRPAQAARSLLRLAPYFVVPVVAGVILWVSVGQGFEGAAAKKHHKDYWRKNVGTWREAHVPDIARADVDLSLDPARRRLGTRGSYVLVNRRDSSLAAIPLTVGDNWEHLRWTMNGRAYVPDDKQGLFVFRPTHPLHVGDSLRIGFSFDARFPKGISKNGAHLEEFVLPSGVVLTSFSASFVPVVGYLPDVGVEKDNRFEPRQYPDDFYRGITRSAFGSGKPFSVHMRVTIPAAYEVNGVGTRVSDRVTRGSRTVVWASDHPVSFFNVVAGRWRVRPGHGTAVYYYAGHPYNVDEISRTLDAARRYYSEWFYPYPWRELKVSEFPALATYAQGFPTNITFSEGIGFLTKQEPKADATFLVTAHESAHQWWGNIVLPGEGPGGDLLSEGMAHFSTLLLFEQVRGPKGRIEFAKRIESRYADQRQVDSERPLVKIDGSRPTDKTVTYDKAGWVFWMLLNEMGRDRALAGLRDFIGRYSQNPDHPVLQDFIAVMREHAPDTAAYDRFVHQWFYSVVVPQYTLTGARRTSTGGDWTATVRIANTGGGRMPVEVAATAGERFPKSANAGKNRAGAVAASPSTPYRDARVSVELGPGESRVVTVRCLFKPERIIVDPDALVLQLNRKQAVASL